MEKIMKYSVLRYIPSKLSGEVINLGILFSDASNGFNEFKFTKNFSRILSFDDSLCKKTLFALLKGIQEEVDEKVNDTKFDIDEYTRYYINEFCFDKPIMIKYDSLDEVRNSLFKSYFRYDLDKKNRPSASDDRKMLSRIIKSNGTDLFNEKKIVGSFQDEVSYDIITKDYYVKIFDFDGKDLKRIINTAKMWSWNCDHSDKKVYIVYRCSEKELSNYNFEIIKNIFKESKGHFCSVEESINLLKNVG